MPAAKHIADKPLTPNETSEYLLSRWGLKRSTRTLQLYRRVGDGPPFYRAGNDIRYDRAVVDGWAAMLLGKPLCNTGEADARRRLLEAGEG